MADSGHPPAELHERLLICRTIKLNAGALGGHRRCCHAKMQKNAQNKPKIARFILCVHTTLQVYCNLFLTFCGFFRQLFHSQIHSRRHHGSFFCGRGGAEGADFVTVRPAKYVCRYVWLTNGSPAGSGRR